MECDLLAERISAAFSTTHNPTAGSRASPDSRTTTRLHTTDMKIITLTPEALRDTINAIGTSKPMMLTVMDTVEQLEFTEPLKGYAGWIDWKWWHQNTIWPEAVYYVKPDDTIYLTLEVLAKHNAWRATQGLKPIEADGPKDYAPSEPVENRELNDTATTTSSFYQEYWDPINKTWGLVGIGPADNFVLSMHDTYEKAYKTMHRYSEMFPEWIYRVKERNDATPQRVLAIAYSAMQNGKPCPTPKETNEN